MGNEVENVYYDLDNIIGFIFDQTKDNKDCDITEVYGLDDKTKELVLLNKQINESKKNSNDSISAIKYDLIKNMMALISNVTNGEVISVGERIALNTFASYDFIKKID